MTDYDYSVSDEILQWLLEDKNPSVKYYTLVDLLDKSTNNSSVQQSKEMIMEHGIVSKILSRQHEDGYWGKPDDFYIRSKYKGTVWNLIILAEMGADKNDSRIKKTCEFILNNSYSPNRGGFSYSRSKSGGGTASTVLPCLTGNMIWSLIRFGYLHNSNVKKSIEWITKYQRFDDGEQVVPKDWPYKAHKACFSKHTCHLGVVKSLKALVEIPDKERTDKVQKTIDKALEYLMIHHIYKKSHDLSQLSKPSWIKLGFPNMYQTDILEILDILTKLKFYDVRMNDAISILIEKQTKEKKWILENTFNGRFITNIEQKGKPSKWITLIALRTLKRLQTLTIH